MNRPPEPLWLAVRLPALAVEALGLLPAGRALLVSERERVFYASQEAAALGAMSGMNITTASLLSQAEVHLRNPNQEQQLLAELAAALYQFTPHLDVLHNGTEAGVLLEISRSLKLFHGCEALARQVHSVLAENGFSFHQGLAHSAPGAWLLSAYDYPITGSESRALLQARLAQVPLNALHAWPAAVASLTKSGFTTLGDLAQQINTHHMGSLRRRLGSAFCDYLSEVFAIEQNFQQPSLFTKPRPLYQPRERYQDSLQLDYPLGDVAQLKPLVAELLARLGQYLQKRQLECQQVEWVFKDIYGNRQALAVSADEPQAQGALLAELTCIRLEHQQLQFAVDTLELHCQHTSPLGNRAEPLPLQAGPKRAAEQAFSLTLARLKNLLGDSAVGKLSYRDSPTPEASQQLIAANANAYQQLPPKQQVALRPAWLMPVPQAIQQRPLGLFWHGYLRLRTKVERIESHWWDAPIGRDYCLAERDDGVRLWVFHHLKEQRWYVHGVFA